MPAARLSVDYPHPFPYLSVSAPGGLLIDVLFLHTMMQPFTIIPILESKTQRVIDRVRRHAAEHLVNLWRHEIETIKRNQTTLGPMGVTCIAATSRGRIFHCRRISELAILGLDIRLKPSCVSFS